MPKIIHTADLHLDAPFSLFDPQKAQARKNELRGVFSSLIMYAKTEKADMVIIAGDFFDHGFVTKETMSLITSQFASVPECKFVISPGNHDCLSQKSPYVKTVFPPNVYIFNSENISRFEFPDINTDVYGWAFTSPTMEKNPLEHHIAVNPDRINILAVHADMTGKASNNCPITAEDIEKSNCDYAALGHIHAGTEVKTAGKTYYAYSGCLEGRSFDECGTKGAIICDITKENGIAKTGFTYKRFCRRRYEKFELDITSAELKSDVVSKIKSEIAHRAISSDTLLRVILTGTVSPEKNIKVNEITEADIGVFYLEIKDKTVPLLSYEELKNALSVKGAFFRELLPKLESENEDERILAAQALRYGLAALSGSDIIDF